MLYTDINLNGKDDSVAEIRRLSQEYAGDLSAVKIGGIDADKMSLADFYDYVKNIPYRRDIAPREIVARPAILLKHGKKTGLDCKKKCTLILSWAKQRGVPARIITSSRRPDKRHHHVFPQLYIDGKWINVDATYPTYNFGEKKLLTSWKPYNV